MLTQQPFVVRSRQLLCVKTLQKIPTGPEALVRAHEIMVELNASHANMTVEDYQLDTGKRALAYTTTSLMIGIMLT